MSMKDVAKNIKDSQCSNTKKLSLLCKMLAAGLCYHCCLKKCGFFLYFVLIAVLQVAVIRAYNIEYSLRQEFY